MRQIELIQPKLIRRHGPRFAAQTLLDSDASIASLRGGCTATPGCRSS